MGRFTLSRQEMFVSLEEQKNEPPQELEDRLMEMETAEPETEDDRRLASLEELVQTIRDSADKLLRDKTSRGDVKVLSRAIRELRYAFRVFQPYRRRRKVTVFGSARTPPGDPAYEQAVEFGRSIAEHGWMVVTGAAHGIMEAGHVGAGREHSMGINIMLPFEQSANPIIAGDPKLVHMKYFFTRKLMFVKECDALVCCQGGFGTLDEGLEVLTLLQTGKRDMVPVVFLDAPGDDYWRRFDEFVRSHLLARRLISPEDLSLYRVTDNCQEAVDEILHFFRVYHSMRYVKRRLVFRLQHALEPALLEGINREFADILAEGTFEQRDALSAEKDEPELAELPRLVFVFDRRSLGRLRQLINVINHGSL
jgi:uncharacterized protein (TIGR00730 family)